MKDYYERVKQVLTEQPETRDDDMKLYAIMVHRLVRIPTSIGFYEAMYNHHKYDLPSYESITRARRKVQENEPHLRGKKRNRRKEMEQEYREYYSPRG